MSILSVVKGWFSYGTTSMGENLGIQNGVPRGRLVPDVSPVGIDGALQISAVWCAVALLANTIATLPLMAYRNKNGDREVARDSALWLLLHENPNDRMTPCEFWVAMIMNLLFRGNAYARIERSANGEAFALWPMPTDQVVMNILDTGKIVYIYRLGNDVAAIAPENMLHLKGMGNGTVGLSRLDYMSATTSEAMNSQAVANGLFKNGGKPCGVLMIDKVLNKQQRDALKEKFADLAQGNTARLHILEADMKYQAVNMTPENIQLLSTRQLGIQEIGRWFGVPSILLNQTEGTTTLGSSSGDIIDCFHKLTIRPALVAIEQALRKRVMTPAQRLIYTVEYNQDALLRASLKDRMSIYATGTQNAIYTRNECRQLENMPPVAGGDVLTAQVNLAPLELLGKISHTGGGNVVTQAPIAS